MASKAGLKRARSLVGGKNRVQFSTSMTVMLFEVQHPSCNDELWYNDADYDRFQLDCKKAAATTLVEMMVLSATKPAQRKEVVVPRGLEHRLDLERRQRQSLAIRAVMESQKKLRRSMAHRRLGLGASQEEIVDVDAVLSIVPPTAKETEENQRLLSRVSTKFTKWASKVALAAAARDAREATSAEDRTANVSVGDADGCDDGLAEDGLERVLKRRRTSQEEEDVTNTRNAFPSGS